MKQTFIKHTIISLCTIALISACGESSNTTKDNPPPIDNTQPETSSIPENNITKNIEGDISYVKLSNRNPNCSAYAGDYIANIIDIQEGKTLDSKLTISATQTHCTLISNNIPNHDVGGNTTTGKNFATKVQSNSKNYTLTIVQNPTKTSTPTYIKKIAATLTLNGILLNGVDLDMDSAFCYHPDIRAPLNVGLGTRQQCGLNADWYAVPANNTDIVTLDEFTGHAFDGRYHYHGDNNSLSHNDSNETLSLNLEEIDPSGSPVIGFAPDGFPIYGHYIYDEEINGLRKATSSWTTFTQERETPTNALVLAPSIETHPRGMFVEDWYYESGKGDLDECNGMTDAYGNYGYYYTEEYPYAPICVFGEPDDSFVLDSSSFAGE